MATQWWVGGSSTAWATGGNWSGGASAPADGDTAIFDFHATQINGVAGSDQSSTELAALQIDSTYIYAFGTDGTPMKVDATLCEIGRPSGSSTPGAGSGRINLWLPDIVSTVYVYGTKASSTDSGKEPVRIKTGANANKLTISGTSRVGVATDTVGDAAQFSEIALLNTASLVNIGAGTTLTTFRQEAGTGYLYNSHTNFTQNGGTAYHYGAGTIGTATVAGIAYLNASGAITAAKVYGGGHLNLLYSLAKTITTLTLFKGAQLTMDPGVITVTNPIILSGCAPEDVTINLPPGRTAVFA